MLVTARPGTIGATPELSCDRCGETFRTTTPTPATTATATTTGVGTADRQTIWAAAASRGWQAERLGGMWWHRCPRCTMPSS